MKTHSIFELTSKLICNNYCTKILVAFFLCITFFYQAASAEDFDVQLTPSLYSGGYNISCHGASNGSINLFISGGIAPYSFSWTDGTSLRNRNNLTAGYYKVIVTAANGQKLARDITLTQPDVFQVDLYPEEYKGAVHISEAGASDGSITSEVKGGVPPYTFLWSNSSNEQRISKLSAGYYSVQVNDATNCTATSSILLIEPSPLHIVSINSPTISNSPYHTSCGNTNGAIQLQVAGGTPPYSYKWNNGEFTKDLSAISAGIYKVQVSDANGAMVDTSIVLNSSPLVNFTITKFTYPNGANTSCASCTNGSILLNALSGTPPFIFQWSNGTTSQNNTQLAAGSYSVRIIDALGCTSALNEYNDIQLVAPEREDWGLTGNANIDSSRFIGSTTAQDVVFKSNNMKALTLGANQTISIGTPSPQSKLAVAAESYFSKLLHAHSGIALNSSSTERIVCDSSSLGKYIYFGNPSAKFTSCLTPNLSNVNKRYSFDGFMASQNAASSASSAALIMGSAPWDGNGIIEVEGSNSNSASQNELLVNYFCGRNVGICSNPAKGGIVSIGKNLEVGFPFPRNTLITANISSSLQTGVRISTQTASTSSSLPAAYNTQLSVSNSNTKIIAGLMQNTFGYEQEIFSIKGDGLTSFGLNSDPAFFIQPCIDPSNFQYLPAKVGIGTNNPQARLHVEGDVCISSLKNGTSTFNLVQADADGKLSKVSAATFSNLGLWQTNSGDVYRSAGKVGIGTSTPNGDLQVGDGITRVSLGNFWNSTTPWMTSYIGFNAGREKIQGAQIGEPQGVWTINGASGLANAASMIASSLNGDMRFYTLPPNAQTPEVSIQKSDADMLAYEKLIIRSDGKIGIGQPANYNGNFKLYVKDGIITDRIKVAVCGSPEWMDVVFDNDYKLRNLNELESFIHKYKHLPEIPSTNEVIRDGIDIGWMQKKFLQKIEELTLYIIDQNKRIAELENKHSNQ